jgi:hypothetical protein
MPILELERNYFQEILPSLLASGARAEEGDSESQKRIFLQDAERSACR